MSARPCLSFACRGRRKPWSIPRAWETRNIALSCRVCSAAAGPATGTPRAITRAGAQPRDGAYGHPTYFAARNSGHAVDEPITEGLPELSGHLGSVVVTGRCESDDELARARLVNL